MLRNWRYDLTVLSSWQLRKTQAGFAAGPFGFLGARRNALCDCRAVGDECVVRAWWRATRSRRKWGRWPVLLGPVMYFALRRGKMAA